jgi:hypothetical protein
MRIVQGLTGALLLGSGVAANATTVVIFIDPMTFDHYTQVINTPGPDRAVMCMAPPAVANCHEMRVKRS